MPVPYTGDLFFLLLPIVVYESDDMYGVVDDNVEMVLVELRAGIGAPSDDWPLSRPDVGVTSVYDQLVSRLQ